MIVATLKMMRNYRNRDRNNLCGNSLGWAQVYKGTDSKFTDGDDDNCLSPYSSLLHMSNYFLKTAEL